MKRMSLAACRFKNFEKMALHNFLVIVSKTRIVTEGKTQDTVAAFRTLQGDATGAYGGRFNKPCHSMLNLCTGSTWVTGL